jgi:hypothetical protein
VHLFIHRALQKWRRRPSLLAPRASLTIVLLLTIGAVAHADWRVGVTAEEGLQLLGGPLTNRLARPDGVTAASVDAITSASRPAHGGGLHLDLRRGGNGALLLGLEYVHYRFDLDYGVARADLDVISLRLLALARLPLFQRGGAALLSFDFGPYLELTLYDRAELTGAQVDIELEPVTVGVAIGFRLEPLRIRLSRERGALIPGLYFRGYRGLLTHMIDDRGSSAPLVSAIIGLGLRYELPASQGNGRAGP